MEKLRVKKSFFEAMAVLASGGKVRNKNWSSDALYVKKEPLLSYPVAVFHKRLQTINGKDIIERIGWSPSIIDPVGEWEIIEEAREPLEDTFGFAILQLFDKQWLEVKHKSWSGNKVIKISEHTSIEEKYYTLHLCDKDNGKTFDYFPTIPDILRKEWIIID